MNKLSNSISKLHQLLHKIQGYGIYKQINCHVTVSKKVRDIRSSGGVTHKVILGIVCYSKQKGRCHLEFTRISPASHGLILGIVCCHG